MLKTSFLSVEKTIPSQNMVDSHPNPSEYTSDHSNEDFESSESESSEQKSQSNEENTAVPEKQMSKEDVIELINRWRQTRSLMQNHPNPAFKIPKCKGIYPYFDLFRYSKFDINTLEIETWEELKVTMLKSPHVLLGGGEYGIAWVRDEKSAVVFKVVRAKYIPSFISTSSDLLVTF